MGLHTIPRRARTATPPVGFAASGEQGVMCSAYPALRSASLWGSAESGPTLCSWTAHTSGFRVRKDGSAVLSAVTLMVAR
eukprot:4738431-Alexandrium_andersonii.AAC.1